MTPKKYKHPGLIVAQQMKEHNLTIRDLAFLLGKGYQIVYGVIRGNRPISIDFAHRCAIVFSVSPLMYLNAQNEYNLGDFPLSARDRDKIMNRYFKELPEFQAKKSVHQKKCGRKWND